MEERFTYDMLDRLTGVVEGLDTTGVFAYDAYGRMTSKYLHGEMVGNDTVRTKVYAGNCEYVTEGSGTHSTSHWITYISGPLGVFAVRDTRMQPESRRMYYVHPDHLGSWTTVTGWNGTVVQDVWFDPWGTAYTIDGFNEPSPVTALLFDRGFTGHEHMMQFDLINMNGRVYDPVTSTFLSVDNYVQDPSYTQNFNRYAYCMNNPLKYTDPDGEWIQYLIGGLMGAWNGYSIGKAAGLKGWDLAWSAIGGAFGTATAYANGAREEDLVNAFIKGFGGGLMGGAAGSAIGGYVGGGWGALAGGFTSSSVATAFQYDNFQDVQWGNVILNGVFGAAMGLSVYHATTAYSYHNSGLQSTLSYKQYSKLIRITQRSMMTNREAKFVAYSDGSSISRLGSAHHVSSEGISYENAVFDYHTHPSPANSLADGEGFSTFNSAQQATGDGTKSDEFRRSVLTTTYDYKKPMYLGTREGHFWYLNSDWTRGMVNGFDHSSVFFYRQDLYMFYSY